MNIQTTPKELAWRCRRGTRELDRMVLYFLDIHYSYASPGLQAAFTRLLDLPDPDLYTVLTATQVDTDPEVEKIKQLICQNLPVHSQHQS